MAKEEISLIILDAVVKGIWCSPVGGQISLETVSKESDYGTLRHLEKTTKVLNDVKYAKGDFVDSFIKRFLGEATSMEEANLLWYGTHVKVAVEMKEAVDEIVPRPIAIINPENNDFVLNYNEFYAYGKVPSLKAFKRTPSSPIETRTVMVDKYVDFSNYIAQKYGLSAETLEKIIASKLDNPTVDSDFEASEEVYRMGYKK